MANPSDQSAKSNAALRQVCGSRAGGFTSGRGGKSITDLRRETKVSAGVSAAQLEHTLILGPTGVGKSEYAALTYFGEVLRRPDRMPTMLLDCHGSFAEKAAIKCMEFGLMQSGHALFDKIGNLKNGLGYGFFAPSTNPDPEERESENREICQNVKTMIMATEGKMDATLTPGIDEGASHLLSLGINQDPPIPFYWLRDGFNFTSDTYKYIIDHCQNERDKEKSQYYYSMPPNAKVTLVYPITRRMERICGSLQFCKRCAQTFDLVSFFQNHGVLLLSGESVNGLSREDKRNIMTMLLQKVYVLAMAGAFPHGLRIVIDEGLDGGLIDGFFARAARELRKYKVHLVALIQDSLTLPLEVQGPLMTNFKTKIIFRQPNPQAARLFAEMLEIPQMNLLDVKYQDVTKRMVTQGYEEIRTHGTSVSKDKFGGKKQVTETSGTQLRPVQEEVQDLHDRYYTSEEKIVLRQRKLMEQGVGDFHIISTDYLSSDSEHFSMMEMPWPGLLYPGNPPIPLAVYKLRKEMERQYASNPAYMLSPVKYPVWSKPGGTTTPMRKNATKNP